MDILSNKYIVENMTITFAATFLSFLITFLLVPFVGKFAWAVGALDKPASMIKRGERGLKTRIQGKVTPKLGGLGMITGLLAGLLLVNEFFDRNYTIPNGLMVGMLIITLVGMLDDRFYFGSIYQLAGQVLAAFAIVLSGISITSISLMGNDINFNLFSLLFEFGDYTYNFIFPGDFITILWIVGLINAVNWIGGMDALNGVITSIIALTLLIFTLSNGNIPVSVLIALHLGGIIGVLPFNYPPSKIFYGSTGDFLSGYLLATFAILGATRWTTTLIILSIPIIDALLVLLIRLKNNPEARKNPLKLVQISDTNHLHHRLLQSGYSVKTVILIEASVVSVVCGIAVYFANVRKEVTAVTSVGVIILVFFSLIFFLRNRTQRAKQFEALIQSEKKKEEKSQEQKPEVKVIFKDEEDSEDDYERFIY